MYAINGSRLHVEINFACNYSAKCILAPIFSIVIFSNIINIPQCKVMSVSFYLLSTVSGHMIPSPCNVCTILLVLCYLLLVVVA